MTYPLTFPRPTERHQGQLLFLPARAQVVRVGKHIGALGWTCWTIATATGHPSSAYTMLTDADLALGRTEFTTTDLADPELFMLLWTVRLRQAVLGNSQQLGHVLAHEVRRPGQRSVTIDQHSTAVLLTRARVLPVAVLAALRR